MIEALDQQIRHVRGFNRAYTRMAGLLNETLNKSGFTLAEARVLFELAHRDTPSAAEMAADLGLDPAYLARILKRLGARGLLTKASDGLDRRRRRLRLTQAGQGVVADLQRRADDDIGRLLLSLDDNRRSRLVTGTRLVRESLEARPDEGEEVTVRPHRVGDIGWVIHRQALIYAEEYGWDIGYEGLIAGICSHFIAEQKPGKEFCWIAERAGEIVGSIFLVRQDDDVAKLRLLYVEPSARGMGLGRRLVALCVDQARRGGYERLVLWTNDVLGEARRIYQREGFRLIGEERHNSFGKALVGQNWELTL